VHNSFMLGSDPNSQNRFKYREEDLNGAFCQGSNAQCSSSSAQEQMNPDSDDNCRIYPFLPRPIFLTAFRFSSAADHHS